MEDTLTLAEAMEELVSAEDFLDYFAVPYDPAVVHVNRLHILQRFHDYLAKMWSAWAVFGCRPKKISNAASTVCGWSVPTRTSSLPTR